MATTATSGRSVIVVLIAVLNNQHPAGRQLVLPSRGQPLNAGVHAHARPLWHQNPNAKIELSHPPGAWRTRHQEQMSYLPVDPIEN